ncbi:hypothetical protein [uncultured Microscilla sp.]|uniref:hypothetical protein n=1 Tax=uncultured Microscilla sp. TaxID=432653 RepID=UPI00263200AA|nr:hypothetical protein [uncultured Microscilla sp.]
MIAKVLEQDSQRLVLHIKGRRKNLSFVLKIGVAIMGVLLILLKLIGINWWLAILMALGGAVPFVIVLTTLFLRVFKPSRYFVFDKAWNLFQYMRFALDEKGEKIMEASLSSLSKIEGVYDEKTAQEVLVLAFDAADPIILCEAPERGSTLADKEHILLFLKG